MSKKDLEGLENIKEEVIKEEYYSKSELKSLSRELFGVNPEVLEGALSGLPQRDFTISETKDLIEKFLKRKVR